MKIEDQVCSLELAKKLKELGVKQESIFHWDEIIDNFSVEPEIHFSPKHFLPQDKSGIYKATDKSAYVEKYYSAFSVAELGEKLPKRIRNNEWFVSTKNENNSWVSGYQQYDSLIICEYADTEADARAKMLIYLLENNLLSSNT